MIIVLLFLAISLIVLLIIFWQDIQCRRIVAKYLKDRIELEKPTIIIDRKRINPINEDVEKKKLQMQIELIDNMKKEELKKKELINKGIEIR